LWNRSTAAAWDLDWRAGRKLKRYKIQSHWGLKTTVLYQLEVLGSPMVGLTGGKRAWGYGMDLNRRQKVVFDERQENAYGLGVEYSESSTEQS
jgi:hypothetical protein